MEQLRYPKKVSVLIFMALFALLARGQEYVTKSGSPVIPAEREPAVFPLFPKQPSPTDTTAGTYIVVTTPDLLPSLQPFLKWKRQQGFLVETLCTDNPQRDSIRASLALRYASTPAPHYILLTGDVDRIPAFWGKYQPSGIGNHATDLYYAEYTGDYLPEAYVGRLPTSDSTELSQIVNKIISYEQGKWAAEYNQML